MRKTIRFIHRNKVVELDDFAPHETVLDFLRLRAGRMGTKEGCAEGDCGACTVAVGEIHEGELKFEPVNACIHLLGMLDGKALITVDDLADKNGGLHPVQSAMVTAHASQCGFCTPGFVMSLYTLYLRNVAVDRSTVNDWLAGNLCRCTGYRPIVDAALEVLSAPQDQTNNHESLKSLLQGLQNERDMFVGDEEKFFASPSTCNTVSALYEKHPDATLVAGATDVGLWITKQLRFLPKIIYLGRITELNRLHESDTELEIGAGITCAQAERALGRIDPDIAEVMRRYGSKQVRACATIGGNIANGSPIGDSPPVLIALGATLTLQNGNNTRSIPLEDFFIDYGKQDLKPGEFVKSVTIPRLGQNQQFRTYKISKRFDQDISALLGAFCFTVENGVVVDARAAFGGMAATPKRASAFEGAVMGLSLMDEKNWAFVIDTLEQDFKPIGDMRASAGYRMQTAKALALKALTEFASEESTETRLRTRKIVIPAQAGIQ